MERIKGQKPGFSRVVVSIAILVVMGFAAFGAVIASHLKINIKQSAATTAQATPDATTAAASEVDATQQPSTWNTYNDTGYDVASGISIKLPPSWELNIPGVKAVGNTANPSTIISERIIYYPSDTMVSPEDEWNTCAAIVSAAACGAAPGSKTISGTATTINGLATYSATMQNSFGTYHVTVIRGNEPTSNGIPFIEFTTTSSDPTVLSSFAAVMASAAYPTTNN